MIAKNLSTGRLATPSLRPLPARCAHKRMATRSQAAGDVQPQQRADGKTGVLFVCLGNICRSPTAEAVFAAVAERAGASHLFDIDSCGTGGGASGWYKPGGFSYHEGEPADPRMAAAAAKRGVKLKSRSRPLAPGDFARFRHVIAMDDSNVRAITTAAEFWAASGAAGAPAPGAAARQVALMTDYCKANKGARAVPDPYYGGPSGFETVLDLLEDACSGLLEEIRPAAEASAAAAAAAGPQQR